MKVAQFLSTVPDALPAEYAAELAQLQANAPAMGWTFVRRRMASELGADWRVAVSPTSASEAAAAASLGQVHRATLHDGTDVACKLQYPDMPSTVEADLRQLRLAMAIYHRMDNAIQHEEIYKELTEAPARGTRLRARGRADAALSPDAGERPDGACAGAGGRATARGGC